MKCRKKEIHMVQQVLRTYSVKTASCLSEKRRESSQTMGSVKPSLRFRRANTSLFYLPASIQNYNYSLFVSTFSIPYSYACHMVDGMVHQKAVMMFKT